ncbi:MAG: integration host factor subunit beta [Planctomycetota bacterium]|nr:integration host factor subunit beta [Planctomycetota bacterium]
MPTITKKDLVQSISDKMGFNPLQVRDIVQAVLDEIVVQLSQSNRIEFRDFAVFDIRVRPARIGHNPRTLEKVPVPARAVVEFKMGKKMKEAVSLLALEEDRKATGSTLQSNSPVPPASSEASAPVPAPNQQAEGKSTTNPGNDSRNQPN